MHLKNSPDDGHTKDYSMENKDIHKEILGI